MTCIVSELTFKCVVYDFTTWCILLKMIQDYKDLRKFKF